MTQAALADELLDVVVHGPKRATAGLVAEMVHDGEPLPRIGGHWIVAEQRVCRGPSCGQQSCVSARSPARSTSRSRGTRARETAHVRPGCETARDFFTRSCARIGIEMSDDLEVVFERFAVVWPR